MARPWRGIVREFRDILPPIPEEAVVTLLEGNTPLVPAPRLAARIAPGLELYVKVEGQNPTGSFKDRGMTVAVSR
ncbi:MAG TPA: pyridoxal-phosphate dependent enzyme, partial [Candidatus Eisenbacteria bacterium]|nr:pyridoxal-phosphate dependent enzyme [Candidatus Eisenbacteria bacterium]